MAVRRAVAAADVAALQAQPQMHPPAADREAVLAALARVRLDVLDVVAMRAAGHAATVRLGDRDLNPDCQNQNLECCRLHHPPEQGHRTLRPMPRLTAVIMAAGQGT